MKMEIRSSKSTSIKIKEPVVCLCCGESLRSLHDDSYGAIDGGLIGFFYAPYGSTHDGDIYQIAICDKCIERKEKEDKAILRGNYIFGAITNHRGEIVKVEYDE